MIKSYIVTYGECIVLEEIYYFHPPLILFKKRNTSSLRSASLLVIRLIGYFYNQLQSVPFIVVLFLFPYYPCLFPNKNHLTFIPKNFDFVNLSLDLLHWSFGLLVRSERSFPFQFQFPWGRTTRPLWCSTGPFSSETDLCSTTQTSLSVS